MKRLFRCCLVILCLIILTSTRAKPSLATGVCQPQAPQKSGNDLIIDVLGIVDLQNVTVEITLNGSALSGLLVQQMSDSAAGVTIPYAQNGNYNFVLYNKTSSGDIVQSCSATFAYSSGVVTLTTPIGKPAAWLSILNPGFGPPAGLGLDFFKHNVVGFLISLATYGVIVLSLIFLLVGGTMYITSGGNKEGMAKAKNTITYAFIGLVLGMASAIILNILGRFLSFTF